jgi:hypothetical protein
MKLLILMHRNSVPQSMAEAFLHLSPNRLTVCSAVRKREESEQKAIQVCRRQASISAGTYQSLSVNIYPNLGLLITVAPKPTENCPVSCEKVKQTMQSRVV